MAESNIDLDYYINATSEQAKKNLNDTLNMYTYKKGTAFFNVVIADEKLKNSINNISESVIKIANNHKETITANTNLINALDRNSEAQIEEAEKKRQEDTKTRAKIQFAIEQTIAGISKLSGMLNEFKKSEATLYKTLSETNANYTDSLMKISDYANNFGMKQEEFVKMLSENAKDFNTIQNQVGNVLEATNIQWKAISEQTGASHDEIKRGLVTYNKLAISTGKATQLSAKEYKDGAERFIIEAKALGKALGLSTDAVTKLTSLQEKSAKMQMLLTNPQTSKLASSMLGAGFTENEIIYATTGAMTDEVAQSMALNPLKRRMLQDLQARSMNGELSSLEQIQAFAQYMNQNQEYKQLVANDIATRENNNILGLAMRSDIHATALGTSAINQYQSLSNIKDYNTKTSEEQEKETGKPDELKLINATITENNQKIVESTNEIAKTLQLGATNLKNAIELETNVIDKLTEINKKINDSDWFQTIKDEFLTPLVKYSFIINSSISALTGLYMTVKTVSGIFSGFGALLGFITKTTPKSFLKGGNILIKAGNTLIKFAKSISGIIFKAISFGFSKVMPFIGGILSKIITPLLSLPLLLKGALAGIAAYGTYKLGEKAGSKIAEWVVGEKIEDDYKIKTPEEYRKKFAKENPEQYAKMQEIIKAGGPQAYFSKQKQSTLGSVIKEDDKLKEVSSTNTNNIEKNIIEKDKNNEKNDTIQEYLDIISNKLSQITEKLDIGNKNTYDLTKNLPMTNYSF